MLILFSAMFLFWLLLGLLFCWLWNRHFDKIDGVDDDDQY